MDLLNLSAQSLVLGGRLVFLLPTTYDFTDDDLPSHPCLEVIRRVTTGAHLARVRKARARVNSSYSSFFSGGGGEQRTVLEPEVWAEVNHNGEESAV